MAIFMAKTTSRWLGCSRLDRPTWKVSYHTPIHGRAWLGASMVGFWWGEDPTWKPFYVPYHISLYGLTCILAILDLSMHIYLLLSAEDPAWKLFYVLCDLWGPHLEIVYILFSMWKHLAKAIFSDNHICWFLLILQVRLVNLLQQYIVCPRQRRKLRMDTMEKWIIQIPVSPYVNILSHISNRCHSMIWLQFEPIMEYLMSSLMFMFQKCMLVALPSYPAILLVLLYMGE